MTDFDAYIVSTRSQSMLLGRVFSANEGVGAWSRRHRCSAAAVPRTGGFARQCKSHWSDVQVISRSNDHVCVFAALSSGATQRLLWLRRMVMQQWWMYCCNSTHKWISLTRWVLTHRHHHHHYPLRLRSLSHSHPPCLLAVGWTDRTDEGFGFRVHIGGGSLVEAPCASGFTRSCRFQRVSAAETAYMHHWLFIGRMHGAPFGS